ncbi:hypothetical protein R1sor_025655 [Riccia sorocarpa]|uniref:mannan endo-1,4-beta-mannosidase n=1 Tax=Riccia sorocarpa TaxID=122646 RepID=A0ABD3G981_9MARC
MARRSIFWDFIKVAVILFVSQSFLGITVRADIKGGIIRRQGTQFVDSNGNPFLVHGCNFYWLMYQGADQSTRKFVKSVLKDAQTLGLNVGRTWAFSDGGYRALQISPGVYDETVFQALDYAIVQARNHNMRLVLTLVNNYGDFGGKPKYAEWGRQAGYKIPNDDAFFTHDKLKTWYKNHVRKVLTRRNTISGVRYMNDPTIFSWELVNEARCESDPSGNTMARWVEEMAAFVKSIDRYHLLSIGLEGFYGAKNAVSKRWAYPLNMDNTGTDYIRLNKIANIDYATVHSYPDLWLPSWKSPAKTIFLRIWVNMHIRDAMKVLKMPVVFGEFGKNDRVFDYKPEQRQKFFWTIYDSVYSSVEKGLSGVGSMLWQLFPKGMEDWDDGFAVYASDPATARIIDSQGLRLKKVEQAIIKARNATLAESNVIRLWSNNDQVSGNDK